MNVKHLAKHWQLVALTLVLVTVFFILYTIRSVIIPLIVGLVLAYLFFPAISWAETRLPGKGKWLDAKRIILIVLTYLVILGLLSVMAYLIFSTIGQSFALLIDKAPQFFSEALLRLQEWLVRFRGNLPPQIQQELDQALQNLGTSLGDALKGIFTLSIALVPSTIGTIAGFAVLPVFLFYLLKDWEKLGRGLYSNLSPRIAEHIRNILLIMDEMLGRYLRAILLLGLIVGIMALIGLAALGVPYAPVLAVIAGITELIPFIGPWIGGGIGVLVTLAAAPEKAIWVALLFLLIQLAENHFLVPRIQGGYLKIHPAVAIVLLIVGGHFAGFWGLALAVPFTATVFRIYKYVHEAARDEDGHASDLHI